MGLWDNFKKNILSQNDNNDELVQIISLAEQGDANAQNNLGIMYATGKGVRKNYSEAWKWYSLAIKNKHPHAADNREKLAKTMTRAQGVEVDNNMKKWVQSTFEENKPVLETRIKEIIEQHIETLRSKHEQTVYKDDYGNAFYDKWDKEIDYFIEKVILVDHQIDNLLWDSRNPIFYKLCVTAIKNIIG